MEELEDWLSTSQVVLGSLLPAYLRLNVIRLLYRYRHLNGGSLDNLPCTDLLVHKASLKPGTRPHSVKSQKRYSPMHEWWMRKLIKEGIEGGIYESTLAANGALSPWNARVVLVPKEVDGSPDDEPRPASSI
ncbi:hypothetical protein ACJ73_10157 [Blastomyces percursus]|uniref:Uncharacterized protein n=1 Tax=Blastomyces percursus TaxID=1658174 RepID=A0A1J9NZX1_9EURO|nr:hypothetical protein ACJ73_10157 [Blastomyces percursus]